MSMTDWGTKNDQSANPSPKRWALISLKIRNLWTQK